jgi:hypothetical protein
MVMPLVATVGTLGLLVRIGFGDASMLVLGGARCVTRSRHAETPIVATLTRLPLIVLATCGIGLVFTRRHRRPPRGPRGRVERRSRRRAGGGPGRLRKPSTGRAFRTRGAGRTLRFGPAPGAYAPRPAEHRGGGPWFAWNARYVAARTRAAHALAA